MILALELPEWAVSCTSSLYSVVMHLQKSHIVGLVSNRAFHGSVGLCIMNVNSVVPQPEECDVHNLKICRRRTDLYCCLMHCIWMEQVACHSHLHIWHLKGLSQCMIHLLMLSVAALHEMKLTVCMWLCTGRTWFTSCRLFSVSKCLYCIKVRVGCMSRYGGGMSSARQPWRVIHV